MAQVIDSEKYLCRKYNAITDTWIHNDKSGRIVTGMSTAKIHKNYLQKEQRCRSNESR